MEVRDVFFAACGGEGGWDADEDDFLALEEVVRGGFVDGVAYDL